MEVINLGDSDLKPLSLLKFRRIIECDGSDKDVCDFMPELREMKSACPYCAYYFNKINRCDGCPLDLYHFRTDYWGGCMHPEHPFYKWYHNKNKDNAKGMYNLIERV